MENINNLTKKDITCKNPHFFVYKVDFSNAPEVIDSELIYDEILQESWILKYGEKQTWTWDHDGKKIDLGIYILSAECIINGIKHSCSVEKSVIKGRRDIGKQQIRLLYQILEKFSILEKILSQIFFIHII